MKPNNYISRTPRLLKNFDKSITRITPILVSRYGDEQSKTLIRESRTQYETLIPQIPFIGHHDPLLIFMLPTIRALAIYRSLQRQNYTVEDAGQLIYELSKADVRSYPKFIRRLIEYLWFSKIFLLRVRTRAKKSQLRKYPASFVMEYVEGDGKNFDYGINYIECANCKFLSAHNALELAPYICATDKVVSEVLGWGLSRTMTLADGNAKCDFRFKKGGETNIKNLPLPPHNKLKSNKV